MSARTQAIDEDKRVAALERYMFNAEESARDLRYADPDQLAAEMIAARSAWRGAKGTKDEARLGMYHELARFKYDMAYVLRQNQTLTEMVNELLNLADRVKLLEKMVAGK